MLNHRPLLGLLIACAIAASAAPSAGALQAWTVDPLVKLMRNAPVGTDHQATADEARGETATFQLVVRSDQPIQALHCDVRDFRTNGASPRIISGSVIRFVGYVPVVKLIGKPPSDAIGTTKGDYPDPLLEDAAIDVNANDAQPIWITTKIPLDAEPGEYQASAKVIAGTESVSFPLTLHIYAAKVVKTRLWITNWFQRAIGYDPMPKEYSPEFWQMLHFYAHDMAAHRQNVARTIPLELAQYTYDALGKLSVDFSRMDQWIQIFIDEGVVGRIEGQQISWRKNKGDDRYVVSIFVPENGSIVEKRVEPNSPQADGFYSQFLPALEKHVQDRGWLDMWIQHVGDEPVDGNSATYLQACALMRKYAPKLHLMDALLTKKVASQVDLMVPLLDLFQHNFEDFKNLQAGGKELWFYTCWAPQGEYANRMIQLPLIKTRLLPWIDFRYGATGYLHWGYNFWKRDADPRKVIEAAYGAGRPDAVAGDAWIVYPKRHGLGVIDSIRWEAQRDGCEDHELLSQLAEKNPDAARKLVMQQIHDFDAYDTDVASFRKARRRLLQLVSD